MSRIRSFASCGLALACVLVLSACAPDAEAVPVPTVAKEGTRARIVAATFEVRAPEGQAVEGSLLDVLRRVIEERCSGFQPRIVAVRANDVANAVIVELEGEPDAAQQRALELRVESTGAFALLPIVQPDSLAPGSADQRETMLEWRAAHSDGTAAEFNATPPELGGPGLMYRWYPDRLRPEHWYCCDVRGAGARETRFTETDLDPARIVPCFDARGLPALAVQPRAERVDHVRELSKALIDIQVAIVIGDESVLTAPRIMSALGGAMTLEGRLTEVERDALLDVLRAAAMHGRLPFKPSLKRVMPAPK